MSTNSLKSSKNGTTPEKTTDQTGTTIEPLVDKQKEDMKSGGNQVNLWLAACICNLGAWVGGNALTWSSPAVPKLEKGEFLLISEDEGSSLSSLIAFGAGFGPFLASSLVDRVGRKTTLLLTMLMFLISWVLLVVVPQLNVMYLARFISGIGVGSIYTVTPMYVAEIAEVSVRGALLSIMQFFLVGGFLQEYIIGPYVSYQMLIYINLVAPVVYVLTFIWIPESPYYYLNKGKKQEATEALHWFRGKPDREFINKEIIAIEESVLEAQANKGRYIDLFRSRGSLLGLYLSCALVAFQQLSGINVILFYCQTIFEQAGASLDPSISAIIIGAVMLLASAVTPPFTKKFGMKMCLYASAVGMVLSQVVLGFYFFLDYHKYEIVSSLGWMPVTSLIAFIITYCVGIGPLPWAYMGELFPQNLKANASAVTAGFCWFLGFFITRFFSPLTKEIGLHFGFWLFAAFCVLCYAFVYFHLPDTTGKTLQEIQDMLNGKKKSPQKSSA
ncbi:unnamed protein product [Bemisia tabaci]|uniref:Major facilitator superfamily (MFS) profile domain-containing protein n=1 Tax=Bemisia tabaci TaxID=7038 RepID=A0A9P0EYI8_BEMTA|nr:unnamed protein product [Bemisia tabaci]